MQRDVEEEFLELDDFRPDAAACFPPSVAGPHGARLRDRRQRSLRPDAIEDELRQAYGVDDHGAVESDAAADPRRPPCAARPQGYPKESCKLESKSGLGCLPP
jgi:hypothetical protein